MAARHQPSVFMKCFSYRLDQLVLVLFIYNTDKNTLAHHFEMKLCGVETRIPDFKNRAAEYITDRVKKLQQHWIERATPKIPLKICGRRVRVIDNIQLIKSISRPNMRPAVLFSLIFFVCNSGN